MDARKAGAGQMVLVVEDEPMQRMMMADMLYEAGFWSVEAADAHQALHMLETRKDIRIVLADIALPYDFSGLDLAAVIRNRWPDIEIALTSGSIDVAHATLPERAVFFQKPYRFQDVVPVLQSLVQ